MSKAQHPVDPVSTAISMSRALVRPAIGAWGDLDAIAARVGAYRDAGADHVALHVLGAATEYPRP
jgi:2-methylisocitrate lyase-like PEP mutase family enzyme